MGVLKRKVGNGCPWDIFPMRFFIRNGSIALGVDLKIFQVLCDFQQGFGCG
jgi:hypothetical protein